MLKNLKQILSKTLMDSIRPKEAYKHYMDSAFRTHTGVGNDAQIKTNADQKRQLPNWKPEWEKRLTGAIDPDQRGAYKNLQGLILRDLFSREEKPFQVFYQVSTQRAVHLKFHD